LIFFKFAEKMKSFKKDIPAIIGLVATTSIACILGGLINSATMSVIGKVGGTSAHALLPITFTDLILPRLEDGLWAFIPTT
jgi:uncharacterized membrane protein